MSSKRSVSPGPVDLMKDILKMIAEPSSTSSRKRAEAPAQQPAKVNHDYCDECNGGGEIVCCDKCPKSYHINCHIPTIIKLPDGEWFCRSCTSNENAESTPEVPIDINQFPDEDAYIEAMLNKYFPSDGSYNPPLIRYEPEILLQRKYNVKLPARKQLDRQKMIRKIDKCCLCKRGLLRGRLIQCHYCSRLYHLNCLDPPIRDWDHSMRWLCPAHEKFFEVAYPAIFPPGNRILTDSYTMKRQRCELPSLPVNTFFNIPSHIDAMYKKPEENIPATSIKKSSLKILCDVASRELESINSNNKINRYVDIISNDISSKFLAHPDKSKKNNSLLHNQPTASLSCLSLSINISLKKKSLTIGKNPNNNLCLLPYGNCEYISGLHATITYDDKLGDYLVKNHSRHGIIVDNVSYFGNHRPKDLSNCSEQKKINSLVMKHINKRRRSVRKHDMFRIYQNTESEKFVLSYVSKRKRFDYGQMSKYELSKIKNFNNYMNKHAYRRTQCSCSKRFIPKDGYAGVAVLRNDSIMSIGCMKFKFTYDTYSREIPKVCIKSKQEQTIIRNKQPLNGTRLKSQSEQENCINKVNGIRNKLELVTTNGHCSLDNKSDTNFLNDQNNTSTFNLDKLEDRGPLNGKTKVNGLLDIKITQDNSIKQSLDTILSISPPMPCTKQWNNKNGISSKTQPCFANDLIQEVEVNVSSEEGETIEEEEIVYYTETDNSAVECNNDVQNWIIEEEIVDDEVGNYNGNEHSVDLQLASTEKYCVHNHNHGAYKTEHLYCARSPSYNEPIVISDDDDDE